MGAFKTLFNPFQGAGTFWPQDQPPYNQIAQATTRVTADNAFGLPAFWAAVRVLSEDIAKLPFIVYERLEPFGKRRAPEHPLFRVLHDSPNPEMTSFVWREVSMAHLVTWGNCYSEIVRNRLGEVVQLWPLRPDRVRVMRDDMTDQKFYRVYDKAGSYTRLEAVDVFHVPGLGYDGNVGYSVINTLAKAIGLGLSAQEYARRLWDNNARPGGILTVPKETPMTDEATNKLRNQFAASHEGLSNAQRFAILRDGITFNEVGIPPEDAQFIQTRTFQTQEIARGMRLSPHKIGDLSRATFSNIEQLALEHVQDALGGWSARIEQQVQKDLFDSKDTNHFAEFLFDSLLRADGLSRAQKLWIERQGGALNADEWRDIEQRNPLPNGEGTTYLQPLNMTPVGLVPPSAEPELIKPKPPGQLNPLNPESPEAGTTP